MFNKLKFFSLIFAAVFMVACSSNDTQESSSDAGVDTDAASESATTDTASTDTASTDTDAAAAAAAAAAADQANAAAEALTVYYFAFDESSLNADTREALDLVATALKNSTANIRLEGHADERGTREYNLGLGERRANAVKRYITAQGVDASRIEVISYGEEKPVAMGADKASMAKNRRVELVK